MFLLSLFDWSAIIWSDWKITYSSHLNFIHLPRVKEVEGYLHRVSPMETGTKTAYFDCTLQLEEGQVGVIFFHPHYRGQFKDLSTKKTAVKITNLRSNDKFGRIDLIVDRKTIICEAPEKLSFQPAKGFECRHSKHFSNQRFCKSWNNRQTNIKAKLCELLRKKATTTPFGTLKKQMA